MVLRRSVDARDVIALLDAEEREALRAEQGGNDLTDVEAYDAGSLLQWLAVRRTPFVKMAAGVCAMLTSLESSLRGNVSFIVLAEQGADLSVDFRPQMRGAIATALRMSALETAVGLERKLQETRQRVRQLCDNFRPLPVSRPNSTGKRLRDMAAAARDPRERLLREVQAQHFSLPQLEFNPTDVAAMGRVAAAATDLQALAERLVGGAKSVSGFAAKDGDRAASLIRSVRQMTKATADKAAQARARRSQEYPPVGRRMDESRYMGTERSIAALKSALLAASEAEQAAGDLFDFFSLEFWQQRWRLYELWIMAQVLEWFTKRGGIVCDSSRIVEGRWLLKFSSDSRPVLGLQHMGGYFDLYYQYLEAGSQRANMPDIALKMRDGSFIAVLDPKHGETYSRHDLNEVCRRYAAAFAPAASCVMNYFPRTEPVERLSADPICTVFYGMRPDGETDGLLDAELDAAMRAAWRRADAAKATVAVLLDISPSTVSVRDALCEQARRALNASLFACSAESRILLFAEGISVDADVWDFLNGAVDCSVTAEGTDIAGALYAALETLAASQLPIELWLFTDGEGNFGLDELTARLKQARARLRVWEVAPKTKPSLLSNLAAAVNGDYQNVS